MVVEHVSRREPFSLRNGSTRAIPSQSWSAEKANGALGWMGGSAVPEVVAVESDGTTFFVEVADAGGVGTVGLDDVMSFDGVAETVTAIARSLSSAWEAVRPDEASVEFGLRVTGKAGKLTGLLVEGGGEASLRVTLSWKSAAAAGGSPSSL
jgi:hypothetical protein